MSEILKYSINDGKEHQTAGKHLILDIWAANVDLLISIKETIEEKIIEKLKKIIIESGSQVINTDSVIFDNNSYSLYFLLTESHFSVHTWPEHSYVSIDFYTCNCKTNMNKVKDKLLEFFEGKTYQFQILNRGIYGKF